MTDVGSTTRRPVLLASLAALGLGALLLLLMSPAAASAPAQSVSRDEAIEQLDIVRTSIDRTLALVKAGQAEEAFAEALSLIHI